MFRTRTTSEKNVSRHLRCASLELELGATILDLRWVAAQGETGGVLRLKNDLDILQAAVEHNFVSTGADELFANVTIVSNIIIAIAGDFQNGIRVLNQLFYAYLSGLSKKKEWIRRYLERIKQVTPKPFLVPSVAFYKHPVDDLKLDIDLKLPDQKDFAYFMTDFSAKDWYCVTGANNDVVVYNLGNRSRLMFNSDASKLISGSLNNRVIVWDWKGTESPHLILKGHKRAISSLSLSSDESRLFSGSLDGTVRIWDMVTGHYLREIIYGTEVECVSAHLCRYS